MPKQSQASRSSLHIKASSTGITCSGSRQPTGMPPIWAKGHHLSWAAHVQPAAHRGGHYLRNRVGHRWRRQRPLAQRASSAPPPSPFP